MKKPIDLATMENRCVSDLYTTPQKFVDDFALMMNNAVLYNGVRMSFADHSSVTSRNCFINVVRH